MAVAALYGNLAQAFSSAVAVGGRAITVHDSTDDPNGPFRALWVGAVGDVSLKGLDGTEFILKNVPVGVLPVACFRINNTGTSVATPNTNIVGLK